MKRLLIIASLIGQLTAYACSIDELSQNNYLNCIKHMGYLADRSRRICECIEANMDWEYMIKNKTYIDFERCEFMKLDELFKETVVKNLCLNYQ
jgi:hypothetical protein